MEQHKESMALKQAQPKMLIKEGKLTFIGKEDKSPIEKSTIGDNILGEQCLTKKCNKEDVYEEQDEWNNLFLAKTTDQESKPDVDAIKLATISSIRNMMSKKHDKGYVCSKCNKRSGS